MQEKVYQTHIANIDELKHRLVQVWSELDHRHIPAAIGSDNAVSKRVTLMWKLKGTF